MRIFTEKGFQEELEKRKAEQEFHDHIIRQFHNTEMHIDKLERKVEELMFKVNEMEKRGEQE